MKKIKWYLILINLIALLLYINYSVIKKEDLLKNGELILIQLAPIDPRSLMQGDYMILNYNLLPEINTDKSNKRGYCVIKVDSNRITKVIRYQNEPTPLQKDEKIIKYTLPNDWSINIGADSYFFEEGQGEKFEKAVYGGIKIDNKGNSLLIGLFDNNLKKIE